LFSYKPQGLGLTEIGFKYDLLKVSDCVLFDKGVNKSLKPKRLKLNKYLYNIFCSIRGLNNFRRKNQQIETGFNNPVII